MPIIPSATTGNGARGGGRSGGGTGGGLTGGPGAGRGGFGYRGPRKEKGIGSGRGGKDQPLIGRGGLFSSRRAARAFSVDGWKIPRSWYWNPPANAVALVKAQIAMRSGRISAVPGFALPLNIEMARRNLKRVFG